MRLRTHLFFAKKHEFIVLPLNTFFRLVRIHFNEFALVCAEWLYSKYGFWRPNIPTTIDKHVGCEDLRQGLIWVRCLDYVNEIFTAFSSWQACFGPFRDLGGMAPPACGCKETDGQQEDSALSIEQASICAPRHCAKTVYAEAPFGITRGLCTFIKLC